MFAAMMTTGSTNIGGTGFVVRFFATILILTILETKPVRIWLNRRWL